MKLLDINGKEVRVQIRQSDYPMREISRSNIQHEVGQKLQEMFPHETILEEFPIPGSRMTVDFLIIRLNLAIEVNGKQHDVFSTFHHGERNQLAFAGQVKRDVKKANWCEMNGFKYIEVRKLEDLNGLKS